MASSLRNDRRPLWPSAGRSVRGAKGQGEDLPCAC